MSFWQQFSPDFVEVFAILAQSSYKEFLQEKTNHVKEEWERCKNQIAQNKLRLLETAQLIPLAQCTFHEYFCENVTKVGKSKWMKAKDKNIKFCFKAQKDAVQFQDKMDVGNQRQLRKSSRRADFGYWGGESSLVTKVCAQAKKEVKVSFFVL